MSSTDLSEQELWDVSMALTVYVETQIEMRALLPEGARADPGLLARCDSLRVRLKRILALAEPDSLSAAVAKACKEMAS